MADETIGRAVVGRVNLLVSVGNDNTYRLGYAQRISGVVTPVDLTTWTAASKIRSFIGGPLLLDITSFITMDSAGVVTIFLPGAATKLPVIYARETGVWDIELTGPAPDNRMVRLASGSVGFSQESTRDD